MAGGVIKSKLNRSNGSAQHGKSVISVARKCDSEKFGTGTWGSCLCYHWRHSAFPVLSEGIASEGDIAVAVVQDYPGNLLHLSSRY